MRQSFHSKASAHKGRPDYWTKERSLSNLHETIGSANYTIIYDKHFGELASVDNRLLANSKKEIVEVDCGTEAKSFLAMLDYIESRDLNDDTIVYLLEDDYIHKPGWVNVLIEGIQSGVSYVTLYDHPDKYTSLYRGYQSTIFFTESTHWRTIPSTTNTYAGLWGTFKEDMAIHRKYSTGVDISRDHEKFLELGQEYRVIASPVPGWSSHCTIGCEAPIVDWAKYSDPLR